MPDASVNLGEELERLYGLPLADFVRARTDLARALRNEGRPDEARTVAELSRPSVAAWAVNQLTRRRRRDVDLLLDAGHRLREAQREVVARGERGEAFDRAVADERRAIRRLAAAVAEILAEDRGKASEPVVECVLATLRAAAITDAGRELLARGAFSEELSASGFGFIGEAQTAPRPRERADALRRDRRERLAAARTGLKDARARLREVEGTQRAAEREVATAERRLGEATQRLRAAEAATAESQAAVRAAKEALETAKNS